MEVKIEIVVNTDNFQEGGNNKDGIFYNEDCIRFTYKGKTFLICKENEKKADGDEYFTFEEAVEHCKKLKDRHLPSIEEWQELLSAWCEWKGYEMDGYGVYDSNDNGKEIGKEFAEDFKLPFAGFRRRDDARVYGQGSRGYYWSSSPHSTSAHDLYFGSSHVNANYTYYRAYGFSVRCFKNS